MSALKINSQEDFEASWAKAKAKNARDIAEWNALPEEEKKRLQEMFDPRFVYRMTSPVTDDCVDPYDEDDFKES
ncbi:MAG: hypothetical protein K2H70_03250 [Bacteroidales bacterium]|nr:hypothetical protein [Bacteroidales bacterium]